MNRIELKELSKRYGKKLVLNGLNLTVRQLPKGIRFFGSDKAAGAPQRQMRLQCIEK